jgi:NADPH2:quinone reductase
MRAFVLARFGDGGSVQEVQEPQPAEGEVRIRVHAASVNPVDWKTGKGYLKDYAEHHFPLILGQDATGVIDRVGTGVQGFAVGDEIYGGVGKSFFGNGTFAELATMSASTIAPKPASIDHVVAASLPVAALTALTAIEAAQVDAGQTVLVVGASGGVGSFAVQMAHLRGASVIAVARGENAEYLRNLGATEIVDYTAGDVVEAVKAAHPQGLDAIIDVVSDKDALTRLSEAVHSGGHIASAVGGADDEALSKRGISGTNIQGAVTSERLVQLGEWIDNGQIRPAEMKTFSLEDADKALAQIETGHTRGKLVLTVS